MRHSGPPVQIRALTTAVPKHRLAQGDVTRSAREIFSNRRPDIGRFAPVYRNAGVETRYSAVPLEWHDSTLGWKARNQRYAQEALDLLERVAAACLEQGALDPKHIDGLVVVSSSGIVTPSLDALLLGRMGFRSDLERLPVFGLGCAGGALGLARAAALARAAPGKTYLLLVVELCSLTFRSLDHSNSNIVATALFGDGAAAALLRATGNGQHPAESGGSRSADILAWGEHTWPETQDVMGWRIEDDGFGVLFSKEIPDLVRARLAAACDSFLSRQGLRLSDIEGHICHPGGTKVLDALADVLDLDAASLSWSRRILRDFGNMSAATVLFVLAEALKTATPGKYLLSALGPGFSAGFVLLEVSDSLPHG